jgi:hypothetical protein
MSGSTCPASVSWKELTDGAVASIKAVFEVYRDGKAALDAPWTELSGKKESDAPGTELICEVEG